MADGNQAVKQESKPVSPQAINVNIYLSNSCMMIKGIVIVNNSGKPRLVKFYQSVSGEDRQQSVIRRVFQQVSIRPDSFCNYLEGSVPEWGENIKLIYRH